MIREIPEIIPLTLRCLSITWANSVGGKKSVGLCSVPKKLEYVRSTPFFLNVAEGVISVKSQLGVPCVRQDSCCDM